MTRSEAKPEVGWVCFMGQGTLRDVPHIDLGCDVELLSLLVFLWQISTKNLKNLERDPVG
jgi:hypothetical protein